MARPRRFVLVVALALAALATLLFAVSDTPTAAAVGRAPEFRHHLRTDEVKRLQERRTLAPIASAAPAFDPWAPGPQAPPRRDPFLVALPRDPSEPLVVLEANALRHSQLGELFVDCLFRAPGGDPFRELRALGFDPLKDLDRVAVSSRGVVVSGFFARTRFDRLVEVSEVSSYGDAGRLLRSPVAAAAGGPVLGIWGTSTLLLGERRFVEEGIDRLEGRAADAPPVIPESLTYGEAYGVLSGKAIAGLFRGDPSGVGQKLADVASRVELHADAMSDVAMTAKVSGPDGGAVEDLGSALGAAMAVARLDARARGSAELAQLLEHARVLRGSGEFSLELAIPMDVLEGWFAGCGAGGGEPSRGAASAR
ncbi:MAG TPA: hypothetical protein VF875_15165 [Anaeromyxobacter sp.]